MLDKLNRFLQKFMPIITPLSVALGVIFAGWLHTLEYLVPWIFAFMTFSGSLGSNFKDLRKVVLHPLPLFLCLLLLHVFMPLVSLGVGNIVFQDEPYLITGLILAFLIPTGITSLIWVSIYKGNVVLTLSIILIDTLLSPLVVPGVLQLFIGAEIQMNSFDIMIGLLWMVVIPSLLGMLLNQISKGEVKERLGTKLAPFSKIGLGAVVAINSSAIAPYFTNVNKTLFIVIIVVFLMASIGYLFGWICAKLLKEDADTIISLTFNGGMRNISVGAVIAITYFPDLVALPVVVGMLFQQILASISGTVLGRMYRKEIGIKAV
ncbi:putative Na+-dependent transporter [Salirhabdus euzebyi]|uniref:Putative Na+-dependent transporter n=1 Tax=Salirhabdus euzebyi TaxID=394506 RepID=A0A841Q7W8_9BACI|nr:bile acid:sodium symporter family protein [Salirhabdus euzebyi]MBB6454498.1 putative Na+-dependent transporter [Salirhabdus euzebyi]